jgi:hypothetical protein
MRALVVLFWPYLPDMKPHPPKNRDETKALTCGYPKNCQHKCSNRQAAVQCFLDHARSKLHTVTPNSGRVVNIPGVVNMEQLRQWVRAQNGLRR